MVRYESFAIAVALIPGHFGAIPFRRGSPLTKLIFFTGNRLHSMAIIITLTLVSKSKGLSASTTNKITARECYTLKDCEGVQH